jgi:hypothetical protein
LESLFHRGTGSEAHAWIVDQGRGLAIERTVTLGKVRMNGWVEVTQGLQPGDLLIAGDRSGLRGGQKVRITGEAPEPLGESKHGLH